MSMEDHRSGATVRPSRSDAGDSPWLLYPDEPPPFELVNPDGPANILLVCDHASNRIPRRLGGLGLASAQRASHIAWDPGAAEVARGLAARLDAPLILGGYSRLAIDLNRPLESPESIAARSADETIPGNQALTRRARAERVAALFEPYHQAIGRLLDGCAERLPCLLGIHSFTPVLGGERRPWRIGVAYGRDRRLAERLLHVLGGHRDPSIGDNQPYGIDDAYDFTLPTHGEGRGIPHAMIEIRQDGLQTSAAIHAWVARLADACENL